MTLTGPEGAFELNILDYECADSPHFFDRNWLLVNLKTHQNGQHTNHTAPLLSTWEIELLLNWMRSVANHQELSPKLTFVEPALGFRNVSGSNDYRFRIRLDRDARPNWHNNPNEPYWLPVTPNPGELQTAISDLEQQLRRFPVRD